MIQYCLVFLLSFFLVFHSNSEEVLQSEDYIGDMDSFDGDIGTRVINGQYQTGHKNNPGTYDKDFDLESQKLPYPFVRFSELNKTNFIFHKKDSEDLITSKINSKLNTILGIASKCL